MNITHLTALPLNTTLLYPKSRQFPFDEVCEKIVRALEKRNWIVPGIAVKFMECGTGELKVRYVYQIESEEFSLKFGRLQGQFTYPLSDFAAIEELLIPKRKLRVDFDESGPLFFSYVGDDWEKDKDKFNKVSVLNNKLPCLIYSGVIGNRKSSLETVDCAHPQILHTDKVFQDFKEWLNENVLKRIEFVAEAAIVELTNELPIPYPDHLGPFYVKISESTYDRILKGKEDKTQLEPSKRYALIGDGRRLVNLLVKNDGTVPDVAYDGFLHCSFTKPEIKKGSKKCAVVRILPKFANKIYVADVAASKGSYLNSDEIARSQGRTIVPIHEYKGNYKNPKVLIGSTREISFEEVSFVDVRGL